MEGASANPGWTIGGDQQPAGDGRTAANSVLEPVHSLEFTASVKMPPAAMPTTVPMMWSGSGDGDIRSIDFSPDGRMVYCVASDQRVDVWAAVSWYWPEAVGGICFFVLVAWLMIVLRVRRRRQESGTPHCRKCNYNVIGHVPVVAAGGGGKGAERAKIAAGTLCPECGVDLSVKRPRYGRSVLRRVWLPTGIAMVIVLGYAAMMVGLGMGRVPRVGWASTALSVWSTWVDELAERRQVSWLLRHVTVVGRVYEIDTGTGRIVRTVFTRRGYPRLGMRVSPDARTLYYPEATADAAGNLRDGVMLAVSVPSGRVWKRLPAAGFSTEGNPVRIRWAAGEAAVYFAEVDVDRQLSRLRKWNPRTGESAVVVEEEADSWMLTETGGSTGPAIVAGRRYSIIQTPEGVATVSAPGLATDAGKLTVRNARGEVIQSIAVDYQPSILPVVAPASGLILVRAMSGKMQLLNALTGERLGTLGDGNESAAVFLPAKDRQLAALTYLNYVLVRDLEQQRWIAWLRIPADSLAAGARGSPDGRWVGTVAASRVSGGYGRLYLFDLAAISGRGPRAAPPAGAAPGSP